MGGGFISAIVIIAIIVLVYGYIKVKQRDNLVVRDPPSSGRREFEMEDEDVRSHGSNELWNVNGDCHGESLETSS